MKEVESLKEIAFLGVYQYIASSLKANASGPPAQKKRKVLSAPAASARSGKWCVRNTSSVTEAVDSIVKKNLDECLVGGFSRYREELWKEYNNRPQTHRPPVNAFLALVLDNNFTSMKLGVSHFLQGKCCWSA